MLWLTSLALLLGSLTLLVFFTNRQGFLDLSPLPLDRGIGKPRDPYALLPLPTKDFPQIASGPTSERCYNADYQTSLTLLPNISQMTNNYKHKNGESCSAPNHDLILGIYQ